MSPLTQGLRYRAACDVVSATVSHDNLPLRERNITPIIYSVSSYPHNIHVEKATSDARPGTFFDAFGNTIKEEDKT